MNRLRSSPGVMLALVLGCVPACGTSPGTPSDAGQEAGADVLNTPEGGGDAGPPPFATWPRDAVFYHVYVRSFRDSDGDGYGDFPGLASKLDYIASLGVDGVLVLPIFQDDQIISGGYGTTDYGHVTSDYGGDAAFAAFVTAAHGRGLKVALDLSLTIVSAKHPWFISAAASPQAPERSHFMVAPKPCPSFIGSAGIQAWQAFSDGACWYSDYGPTFASSNVRDAPTAEAFYQVAESWIAMGVDGYRLDSASRIGAVDPSMPAAVQNASSPTTHAFWRTFMQRIKAKDASSFVVAELFANQSDYYADGIDMAFDYPIYAGLIDAWIGSGKKTTLAADIAADLASRPPGALAGVFLDNHDVPNALPSSPFGRIADILCPSPCTNVVRLQSAAILLFSLPGTPFVFYGDELGLHGSAQPSTSKLWSRGPMAWDGTASHGFTTAAAPWVPFTSDNANVAAETGVSGSMLETYRGLITVRKTSPALTHGTYQEVPSDSVTVVSFMRADPSERVLVVVNLTATAGTSNLNLGSIGITQAQVSDRIFGTALPAVTSANAAAYPVSLPAFGGGWLLLK